jgi:glycerophosphoryl diester phosphodiesterase
MSEGIRLDAGSRSVRLKWHKARRRASDPPFLRTNLVRGLEEGAALEVDLVATREGDLVCLHDLTLDRETTGSGPARAMPRHEIERLRQRGEGGEVLDDPPLFLDEVVELVRRAPGVVPGSIQLDLKEPIEGLTGELCRRFAAALGDMAYAFTLGGTDWQIIDRMRHAGASGLKIGFDPLAVHEAAPPRSAAGFRAVMALTLDAAPEASILYLYWRLVLEALEHDVDLVGMAHAAGKEVDVWTLDPMGEDALDRVRRVVEAGADQITTNDPVLMERLWRTNETE